MGRSGSVRKSRKKIRFKIPEYRQYFILTVTIAGLFVAGVLTGYFSSGFQQMNYVLSYISYGCYTVGSIGLILWFLIRYMIVHKMWSGHGNNTRVVLLLAIPVLGIIWHYYAYYYWYHKYNKGDKVLLFFLYSLLNTALFIPYVCFYALILYVIADLLVHKEIYRSFLY